MKVNRLVFRQLILWENLTFYQAMPIFSMLSPCTVTIDTAAEPISFEISSGIITVRDNSVNLFVNM